MDNPAIEMHPAVMLNEALALARRGIPVFPVRLEAKANGKFDKRPACENGLHDATTDPDTIKRLFDRSTGARYIGVPMGSGSGLDALDIDPDKMTDASRAWFDRFVGKTVADTRQHQTISGGRHYLFIHDPANNLRNSADKIARGIDLRTEGGYIVWWPAAGLSATGTPMAWDSRLLNEVKARSTYQPAADFDIATLAAPSADDLIDLFRHLPNPASTTRDSWVAMMHAAAGALAGLRATGRLDDLFDDEDRIRDAVLEWSHRWPHSEPETETAKWDEDFSQVTEPRAGWPALVSAAKRAGLTWVAAVDAGAEFGIVEGAEKPLLAGPEPVLGRGGWATPLALRDAEHIPPRQWLYGYDLIRGHVAVLGSPGGVGKTAFTIGVACSVASGRSLLASPGRERFHHVHKPGNVWLYNLEDPADEMLRRLTAAIRTYRLDRSAIGRIFMDSARDRSLVVMTRDERGQLSQALLVEELVREIKARKIDLLIVDPFVHSHQAEENSNDEIAQVMDLWNRIAHVTGCAIWLVHHFRKGGDSSSSDSFRGAAAIQGSARSMHTLAAMTKEEAAGIGLPEGQHRRFIRTENVKANMAPKPDEAEWYELHSVALGNGSPDYPEGDHVQVVLPWCPPVAGSAMTDTDREAILDLIDAGYDGDELYSNTRNAGARWVGTPIVNRMLCSDEEAAAIVRAWVKAGLLRLEDYTSMSRGRKPAKGFKRGFKTA